MQDLKPKKRIIIKRVIIWTILALILALLLIYLQRQRRINRFNKVVSEYLKIDNYQDAKDLFDRDFKNHELKYFTYGMYYDKSYFKEIKNEFNLEIFNMGCINEGRLCLYDYYVETEIIKNTQHENFFTDTSDSLWDCYVRALETKKIDYLISNSFDTIICAELGIPSLSNDERYPSKLIYENYLDKLMHLDDLSTRERSVYKDDDEIKVNYKISSKTAEEGGYNLIFIFKKKGDKYLFYGMIMT
jgi:hypothetical protein